MHYHNVIMLDFFLCFGLARVDVDPALPVRLFCDNNAEIRMQIVYFNKWDTLRSIAILLERM